MCVDSCITWSTFGSLRSCSQLLPSVSHTGLKCKGHLTIAAVLPKIPLHDRSSPILKYIQRSNFPSFAFDIVTRCFITSRLVHVPSLVVAVVVLFFSARYLRRQTSSSRGMILALGAIGPGFKSQKSPVTRPKYILPL